MCTFNVEIIQIRQSVNNILKSETLSNDMKEKIDHWLDSLDFFHINFIIMSI